MSSVCPLFSQWEQTHGPRGGFIFNIQADEENLYAQAYDGIYRIKKGEVMWEKVAEQFQATYELYYLDIDDQEILAVSGKSVSGLPKRLIHTSTDGGDNWTAIALPDSVAPYTGSGVQEGDHIVLFSSQQIWESLDGGLSWHRQSMLESNMLYSLAGASHNGKIYISGSGNNGPKLAIADATNNQFTIFPAPVTFNNFSFVDDVLFGYQMGAERFWRSFNGGITWKDCNPANMGNSDHYVAQFNDTLYSYNRDGIAYSVNDGLTWKTMPNTNFDFSINFIEGFDGSLWIGDYASWVFRSENPSNSWRWADFGINAGASQILNADSLYLYAGVPYRGLYRYNLQSGVWDTTTLLQDPFYKFSPLAVQHNVIYASPADTGIVSFPIGRSFDHGLTWADVTPPSGMAPISKDNNYVSASDKYLMAGIVDIFSEYPWNQVQYPQISSDSGQTWSDLNASLQAVYPGEVIRSADWMGDTLYATTQTGLVYTKDGGATWQARNISVTNGPNNLPLRYASSIGVADTVLFLLIDGRYQLYRSVDRGVSWQPAWNGLPVPHPHRSDRLVDIIQTDSQLVALTESGLYVSLDEGVNWSPYPGGLPPSSIVMMSMHNDQLFVGTSQNGVWKGDLSLFDFQPLEGTVFWDDNNNGQQDAGEAGVPGVIVQLGEPYVHAVTTDSFGRYSLQAYFDGTNRSLKPFIGQFPYTTASPVEYQLSAGADSLDFGLYREPNVQDLKAGLTLAGGLRPGFESWYLAGAYNVGTSTEDAVFKLLIDPALEILEVQPAADFISGDTLIWLWDSLGFLENQTASIRIRVPVGLPLGTVVVSNAWVEPTAGDVNPDNNAVVFEAEVNGSFDPNDKQEVHGANISRAAVENGEPLQYTIRFQNTGTAAAQRVVLTDQLHPLLDLSGLRIDEVSHPFTWSVRNDGYLEFVFDMINLPDSSSDQAGSQGFARFSIPVRKEAPRNADIQNSAAIYFDFNEPVLTNVVNTKMVEPTSAVTGVQTVPDALLVSPNPGSGSFRLLQHDGTPATGFVRVYRQSGELVLQQQTPDGRLDLSSQATGAYYLCLQPVKGKPCWATIVLQR